MGTATIQAGDGQRRSRRRGSMLLEAALIMPLLLMLVMGGIEFGYAYYVKHSLQGAARDGARVGIVPGADNAAIEQAVAESLQASGLAHKRYEVHIRNSTTGAAVDAAAVAAGEGVQVTVSAPWSQFSVFLSGISHLSGELEASTVMRREG